MTSQPPKPTRAFAIVKALLQFSLAAAVIVAGLSLLQWSPNLGLPGASSRSYITLAEIQETADLVVLHVPFQQLVESRLRGYTGSVRCVIIASGEVLIATDLEQAAMDVDEDRRLVTLTLPQPRVLPAGLDHRKARVVLLDRRGLWQIVPGETGEGRVIEFALAEAQRAMLRYAAKDRHLAHARRRAEQVLRTFLAKRGYELEVTWTSST